MTFEDLRLVASGFQPSKLLLVALDVGLFDCLTREVKSADRIAQELDLHPRATEIVANALTSMGLLERSPSGYANAEAARRFLVRGSSEYKGDILRHLHATWEDWGSLGHVWKSGTPARTRETQQLPSSEEGTRNFILGMENLTRELAPQLAEMLPLDGCRKLLDLGGGPGNYALAFVTRVPGLRAVHFDLPATSKIAREFVAGRKGSESVTFVEGDFLADPLGEGYDFVWVSQIIHMLGAEDVQELFRRIRRALVPGGLVAIHDHFLNSDKVSPRSAAVFGVHMLVVTGGGRTYSLDEVETWFKDAGIEPRDRIDYGGPSRVLLGQSPDVP